MTTAERAKKIRTALKKELGLNSKHVSVRTHNYSMGSTINVRMKSTEALLKRTEIENISQSEERVDRCPHTHEILSGGNRFVFVEMDYDFRRNLIESEKEAAVEMATEARNNPNRGYKYKGTEFFYDPRSGVGSSGGFQMIGGGGRSAYNEEEIATWLIVNQFTKEAIENVKNEVVETPDNVVEFPQTETKKEVVEKIEPELQSMVIRELKVRYSGDSTEIINVSSPEAVYKTMKPFYQDQSKEIFSVICVNNKNNIDSWQMVSVGTVSQSIVLPREVFQGALISNSSAVILIHNHPSGDTTPSLEDIATTKRMVESGKILGIPVLDHLIITNNSYLSLKESGNME